MQDISAAFRAAIARGYQAATKVEVWSPGNYVLADSSAFHVVSGSITVDGSADIQRYLSDLVIVDETGDLVPDDAEDLFSPVSGNEIRVYTGLYHGDDPEPELLLQGVFGLEGAKVEDSDGGLTMTVSAYDRARAVSRSRLVNPYRVLASEPPTSTAITAAQDLVRHVRPGTLFVLPDAPDPGLGVPQQDINEGGDAWAAAREIMASIGWEMFFNWDGIVVMRPVLDPNSPNLEAVWHYAEGDDATLLGLARGFSNEEAFNGQIVTGANTTNSYPPRSVVWDDDPSSPTYYLGPYGRVPEHWTSTSIGTDAQALAAAQARLNARKGVTESLEFSVVPNPSHEVGDVVTITRARSKVDQSYIVDRFNLGLGAISGPMSITCRPRRI